MSSPGIYLLLFSLAQDVELTIGRLGVRRFSAGCYGYIGSGMAGVESRVRRHLRPHHRTHWHLDYLLPQGTPLTVIVGYTAQRVECAVAQSLARQFDIITGFGSSDCRCPGHLFYSSFRAPLSGAGLSAMVHHGCSAAITPLEQITGPTGS